MEAAVLGNFVKREVEILVGGVWVAGYMTPIVKGVITLIPIGVEKEFYGPTALKAEAVQAIREVRKQPGANTAPTVPSDPSAPPATRSAFETANPGHHPGMKYVHKVR